MYTDIEPSFGEYSELVDRVSRLEEGGLHPETLSMEAISDLLRTGEIELVTARDGRKRKVAVYWYFKINTQIVNTHIASDERHILLIHERPIASQAQAVLRAVTGKTMEIFSLTETLFNPTKHRLVPKHELCSEERKTQVLAEYAINRKAAESTGSAGTLGGEEMFPPIFASDIISRWFAAKKGQMFAIYRIDTVHPGTTTLVYRVVR